MWAIQVCEGYGFQAVKSGICYRKQSLGLEQGIIFQENDQLIEDFNLDQGYRELTLKKIKSANWKLTTTQFNTKESVGIGSFREWWFQDRYQGLRKFGLVQDIQQS